MQDKSRSTLFQHSFLPDTKHRAWFRMVLFGWKRPSFFSGDFWIQLPHVSQGLLTMEKMVSWSSEAKVKKRLAGVGVDFKHRSFFVPVLEGCQLMRMETYCHCSVWFEKRSISWSKFIILALHGSALPKVSTSQVFFRGTRYHDPALDQSIWKSWDRNVRIGERRFKKPISLYLQDKWVQGAKPSRDNKRIHVFFVHPLLPSENKMDDPTLETCLEGSGYTLHAPLTGCYLRKRITEKQRLPSCANSSQKVLLVFRWFKHFESYSHLFCY